MLTSTKWLIWDCVFKASVLHREQQYNLLFLILLPDLGIPLAPMPLSQGLILPIQLPLAQHDVIYPVGQPPVQALPGMVSRARQETNHIHLRMLVRLFRKSSIDLIGNQVTQWGLKSQPVGGHVTLTHVILAAHSSLNFASRCRRLPVLKAMTS